MLEVEAGRSVVVAELAGDVAAMRVRVNLMGPGHSGPIYSAEVVIKTS